MNTTKPPSPPDTEKANEAREDDLELWRGVMRDVTPLPGRRAPPPAKANPREKTASDVNPAPRPAATSIAPTPAGPALLGLDKRSAQRLRRGQMAIEARLDLHGVTQKEAHAMLCSFLARTQDSAKRCVLVITGKGLGRAEGGVLRKMVPRWLEQPPLRDRVLAATPAQAQHGGDGACYILLRKKR